MSDQPTTLYEDIAAAKQLRTQIIDSFNVAVEERIGNLRFLNNQKRGTLIKPEALEELIQFNIRKFEDTFHAYKRTLAHANKDIAKAEEKLFVYEFANKNPIRNESQV